MTWIETIPYHRAGNRLRRLYDRVKSPDGEIDNILMAHGLRPHSLEGHMALYKNVLHHSGNQLPKWLLETLGLYVSLLNSCEYCVDHHFAGLKRLLNDDSRADDIRRALEAGNPKDALDQRGAALTAYAERLTIAPASTNPDSIERLRTAGLSDGEILEANQVIAYFSYANRTVLGLGVSTDDEPLGRSPNDSEDETNWAHK